MDANRQLGRRCAQGGQGLAQCGQAQGLDQPYIHSRFQAALPFFTQGIGGHTNNRHPRVKLTQAARQLIAIESGHIDVGDHQIKRRFLPARQGLFTIVCQRDPNPQGFQLLPEDLLIDGVILGDQNVQFQVCGIGHHTGGRLGDSPMGDLHQRSANGANIIGIDLPTTGSSLRLAAPRLGRQQPLTLPGHCQRLVRVQIQQDCRVVGRKRCRHNLGASAPMV